MEILWDKSYSVGNDDIDRQHQNWIAIYNRLVRAMDDDSRSDLHETKADILNKMSGYAREHFQFEEEYMRSIGYPGIDKHWRLHKDFDNEIYQICRKHADGTIILNSELMDMVKKWLLNHILLEDMKIGEFVKSLAKTDQSE